MLNPSEYLEAVKNTIQGWGIVTVQVNPQFQKEQELSEIMTPAVFIYCDTLGETGGADNGSNLELVQMELSCLIGEQKGDAKNAAFNLASYIKRHTLRNKWGLKSECRYPFRITAQNTTGMTPGFYEWRVSFSQTIELDPPEDEEGFILAEVYLGINPETDEDFKRLGVLENEPGDS